MINVFNLELEKRETNEMLTIQNVMFYSMQRIIKALTIICVEKYEK